MTARKEDMGKEKIRSVEQMPVYQAFLTLALELEKKTRGFGPDFRWLRVQILRSSESVSANMTEGFYSQYSTEYLQALYRCRREARETMTHLSYAQSTNQLPEDIALKLHGRYEQALMQLANLTASIERKIRDRGKTKSGPLLKESKAGYVTGSDDATD
ncbi:MAG: four helix bundle protein [Verrucomicrobiia bacterium]|jgi:four helix bundle protein